MNQVINVGGSAGLSLGVAAAGLLLAYGVWTGRRDLGLRAALGILGTALLTTLLSLIFIFIPFGSAPNTFTGALRLLLLSVLPMLFSFLPLYVAANWLEVIKRSTSAQDG
jgi:hypothetical protein